MRRIVGSLLAVAIALSVTGCNSSHKVVTSDKTEKITLNVWHQWSNDTNELNKKYDEAVAAYQKKNTNIVINTKTLDTEAYKTKISAEFTGEARDIDVFYYWGAGKAKKLVNADKLLALDKYITDDVRERLLDGSTNAFEYDDKLYSLPSFSWYLTLFCNKAIFDEAGAKIPATYDELKSAVEKIKKLAGVTPFASGAKDAWNAALIYQAFALREVGAENVNAMLNGEIGFEDEGYRRAAEKVTELYNMGAFGINPLEEGNEDANTKFVTGKAAMRLMGSWYANGICTDRNATIDQNSVIAIKIPMIYEDGDTSDYCGGFVESFWVNKYTKYPKEAAEFAIYINEVMGAAAYKTGSGFNGWKTEVDESGLNPLFVQVKKLQEEGKNGVLAWDTSLNSGPAEIHNAQVQELFAPNADIDQFIEEHQKIIY